MLANTILKIILAPFRSLFMIVAPVSTCVIGITYAIPFWQSIFRLILAGIWLPFLLYINLTSQLYQQVAALRPLLALVSIPLLLLLDIFNALMPGSHRTDKYDKASMIDSWPFSLWDNVADVPSKDIQRGLVKSILINDGVVPSNGKLNAFRPGMSAANSLAASTLTDDSNHTFRYEASQRDSQSLPDQRLENPVSVNRQQQSCKVDKPKPSDLRTEISTCTLCGDMVRSHWERCPHCDEPLQGVMRLPAIWHKKAVPIDQKVCQVSR